MRKLIGIANQLLKAEDFTLAQHSCWYVNVADFRNWEELYAYISTMTAEEYLRRLDACIQVFNTVSQRESQEQNTRHEIIMKTVQRLKRSRTA